MTSMPYGMSIGNIFKGVVAYADDILLLSSTGFGLQKMLNTCADF